MNKLLFTIATLLALAAVVTASFNCYVGTAGAYASTPGFDCCYKYTTSGVTTKVGLPLFNCSTATLPSGATCCSTNLCNGAKINGMSILMVSAAVIVGLFRTM
ncbi:unnamed protein product [Adineta steineri]|uniref:Uncharacterized protein n=1 Tax=Adineta steineri TaxID=433720 RepID=A0A818HBP9_9BILA|nr:unnamed protein product [Adineta steineri]CAF4120488.1 unnamed protein product [Adineta steineri]